ncbi:MAG TPA: TrbC/VirB2 family protein [Chloroflexota bacterium]|nr:TrbC/VirB2 family protein [Chloroflexota bacterium]
MGLAMASVMVRLSVLAGATTGGSTSFTGMLTKILTTITTPVTVLGGLGIVACGLGMIFGQRGSKEMLIGCIAGIVLVQSASALATLVTG